MKYENHLYMVLYPSNFLISSRLTPEELGQHYLTGYKQNYDSGLIFAEIDNTFRNDYFDIDRGFNQLISHDDDVRFHRNCFTTISCFSLLWIHSISQCYADMK